MATKRNFFREKKRAHSIAHQVANLRIKFPDSKITFDRSRLVWVGKLRPTPLSAVYTVQIRYKFDETPAVTVIDPVLVPREGETLPHVFTGNQLCLFRYKYHEWDSMMLIADTIIPWASLWLSHYEVWLATGVWCGSKAEHPDTNGTK